MKYKYILLLITLIIFTLSCSRFEEKQTITKGKYEKYYQFIKVNNDLTLTGVNELEQDQLENNEYFKFFYENQQLVKIKSFSSIGNYFHELNKYIFNVNKEFSEININTKSNSKEYTFLNSRDLVKFVLTYKDEQPTSVQVIPFNIKYDNFNILGRSVVYSAKILSSDNRIKSIDWNDSNAQYKFNYDKAGSLLSKEIYNNNNILYEYKFDLNNNGIAVGIK